MPEASSETLPTVLVAGLNCSARLYADQIPALWQFGPVTVADHRRDDSMAAMARRILAAAPPRFALVGLSMGGYVAFEIMRQAAVACRQARFARHRRARRGAGADRAAQAAHRFGEERPLRGNPRVAISHPGASQPSQRRGTQGGRARHERGDRRGRLLAPATGHHNARGFTSQPRGDKMPDAGSGRRQRRGDAAGLGPRDGSGNSRCASRRRSRVRASVHHRAT